MAYLPNSNQPTTLRLSDEQKAKIAYLAPLEHRSRNNLIIAMLREGLNKRKKRREASGTNNK